MDGNWNVRSYCVEQRKRLWLPLCRSSSLDDPASPHYIKPFREELNKIHVLFYQQNCNFQFFANTVDRIFNLLDDRGLNPFRGFVK